MASSKLRLALIIVAVAAFLAALLAIGLSGVDRGSDRLTVGERRGAILEKLTELYLSKNPDGPTQTIAGDQLAPATFINGQLRKKGEAWRVRIKDGEPVEIYNVG